LAWPSELPTNVFAFKQLPDFVMVSEKLDPQAIIKIQKDKSEIPVAATLKNPASQFANSYSEVGVWRPKTFRELQKCIPTFSL
jgi:hypothetical protein